jgi:hypothetical protein
MIFKWIEKLPNIPDKSVLMIIEALERRLAKKEDDSETRGLLGTWQEALIMEAEKRGLSI